MASRATPPFRADHVGSLLHPAELLRAREERAAGQITAAKLREAADRAILDAVRLQEQVGLQSATDGEFRRTEWHRDFVNRLGGIREGRVTGTVLGHGPDGQEIAYEAHAAEVTGGVRLVETIFGDDFRFLASAVTTATPKLTIPSPSMAHFRADLSASGYSDPEQFRGDLAAAYAEEIRRLADLGCGYLHLDDTVFAFLNDPRWRATAAASSRPDASKAGTGR